MTLYFRPTSASLTHDTQLFATMDPYVQLKIDGEKKRTRAHKGGGKTPNWNQVLTFKFKQQPHSSKMTIRLYDQERFSDDLIGTVQVPLKKYIENQTQHAQQLALQFKGKSAGVLHATIRFSSQSKDSGWSMSSPSQNSGWSIGGKGDNNGGSNKNLSGWGPNNNGWQNQGGSKSGW